MESPSAAGLLPREQNGRVNRPLGGTPTLPTATALLGCGERSFKKRLDPADLVENPLAARGCCDRFHVASIKACHAKNKKKETARKKIPDHSTCH